MIGDNTYEYNGTTNTSVNPEATRAAFIETLKQAQLNYILKETGNLYRAIRTELVDNNRELLERNNFVDDFTNLVTVARAESTVYEIEPADKTSESIFVPETDELRPVLDIVITNVKNKVSKDDTKVALLPYQEMLARRGLSDLLESGKYSFYERPDKYKVVTKNADGNLINNVIDYTTPELFNVIAEYYEKADNVPTVQANKQIEEFAQSDELIDIYNYIKDKFDDDLETQHLSDEQLRKADELFAQIPVNNFDTKTKENEFCYDALKVARQYFQLEPKLGMEWLQLPSQVQKSPGDLAKKVSGGKVKSSGNKKIKSKAKHVTKMNAKPQKMVTDQDIKDFHQILLNNGNILPLEKIREYTSKMSEDEKRAFIDQIMNMNKMLDKGQVDSATLLNNIVSLPISKDYKWHRIKYLSDKLKFYKFSRQLTKLGKQGKLYENPFGDKPVTIGQLIEDEKENTTKVPVNMLMKVSHEAARELKITQGASKKLKNGKINNTKVDGVKFHPLKKLVQKVKNKFKHLKDLTQPVKNEPKKTVQPKGNLNVSITDLEDKSKEELIAMIKNGSILSAFDLNDIEKEAEQRRAEIEYPKYLQRQKEGLEKFKKRHIIQNAKLNYANDSEKLNDYLIKNNISQLEWEMEEPLSKDEETDIIQQREAERQDFLDYASVLSGIDRYALLRGLPGEEKNQYGITNADVEQYIQERDNASKVTSTEATQGKSK